MKAFVTSWLPHIEQSKQMMIALEERYIFHFFILFLFFSTLANFQFSAILNSSLRFIHQRVLDLKLIIDKWRPQYNYQQQASRVVVSLNEFLSLLKKTRPRLLNRQQAERKANCGIIDEIHSIPKSLSVSLCLHPIPRLYSYFNLLCRIKASSLQDKTEGEYGILMNNYQQN